MQVALISPCGPARNAIGRQLAAKVGFFAERGAEVRVFLGSTDCLHPDLKPFAEQIQAVDKRGPAWDFLSQADLVVADYCQHDRILSFVPMLVGQKPRLVLDYHGVTPAAFWHGYQRDLMQQSACQRSIVWCADFALAHSAFARQELHEATGYPLERIVVLPYPLDTARFRPGRRDGLRRRLALTDEPILLYVGRLAPSKRVPTLLEALIHLPRAHAVLVGADRDVYGIEAEQCRTLANQWNVADRVHFLGEVADDELADIYGGADVLVIPSRHEGYCMPVFEAMACGVPVVAARATALPEAIGAAGLTFTPDDAADLARQIRRVLDAPADALAAPAAAAAAAGKIAVVGFRFGRDIVGGAETSLRTIARTLQQQGAAVEVFTTCTRSECDWTNDFPAGTIAEDGLTIHRLPIDAHDRAAHHVAIRKILDAGGQVSPEIEAEYLRHSIHSTALVDALTKRRDDWDAVIVGPYLFGLTHDVAQALPDRTLLLPCFHDEPLARLQTWVACYNRVGGVLYHSPEEQEHAQTALGLNHPHSFEVGTLLPVVPAAPVERQAGARYLVYCGRYSRQKNLPQLFDFAERYSREHPGRFRWVFLGHGELQLPRAPWAVDLGHVPEPEKRSILAGADALVQLSRQESLSLVVLEAWAQETPVIVAAQCPVLRGQVERSGGGRSVANYDDFARTLDDLWDQPAAWRTLGKRGSEYVQRRYADREKFVATLHDAIASLKKPLGERMRRLGPERAARRDSAAWREAMARVVEQILDAPAASHRFGVAVEPLAGECRAVEGSQSLLLPVRVVNRGTLPALPDAPVQTVLVAEVIGEDAAGAVRTRASTELPRPVAPGQQVAAVARVALPQTPGTYQLVLSVACEQFARAELGQAVVPLTVAPASGINAAAWTVPLLDAAQAALAEAQSLHQLPDDYVDVTEGRFARVKRWIKQKLLGNFKKGYVDPLSRQQSRVNRQLILAVQQLAEGCAALDHALRQVQARLDEAEATPKESHDRTTAPTGCEVSRNERTHQTV